MSSCCFKKNSMIFQGSACEEIYKTSYVPNIWQKWQLLVFKLTFKKFEEEHKSNKT